MPNPHPFRTSLGSWLFCSKMTPSSLILRKQTMPIPRIQNSVIKRHTLASPSIFCCLEKRKVKAKIRTAKITFFISNSFNKMQKLPFTLLYQIKKQKAMLFLYIILSNLKFKLHYFTFYIKTPTGCPVGVDI